MQDFFDRHQKIALQLSGGKDSLACFYLLREFWQRITVVWVNTGDAFPETQKQVREIGQLAGDYIEVQSNQPADINMFGPPSDLLPVWDTTFGRALDGNRHFRIQSPFECCSKNIWAPMAEAIKHGEFTGVIRGQRIEEGKKSPILSGHKEDGVEYFFPLEDWTEHEVFSFLLEQKVDLPDSYRFINTSLDCKNCTAFLADNVRKGEYMMRFHPVAWKKRKQTLQYIKTAVDAEYRHLLNGAYENG
jgi:phosphoadenosine phosphosulfate reductase